MTTALLLAAEGGVHRPGLPRAGAHQPALPRQGPTSDRPPLDAAETARRGSADTAGAGFGEPCDVGVPCSGSLGLACLKTEALDYRCGCAKGTPVFIEEGGVKKCVRAKSMYESCLSNQECSFQNPNLQCVDFLCYCPLPFVLTETHRCLAPPESSKKMVFAVAPTAVLIFALLLIGAAYTYKKVLGGSWSTWNSTAVLPLAQQDPARQVSSAIRLGRKAEASWNPQPSLGEKSSKESVDIPKHPPRYIKGMAKVQKAQKEQKSPPQGSRPRALKDSSKPAPNRSRKQPSNHAVVAPVPPAASAQRTLPSPREVVGHASFRSPTSAEAAVSERAGEDAGGRKRAASQLQPPSDDALSRILNDTGVTVNVERSGCSGAEEKRTSNMDSASSPQQAKGCQRSVSMPLAISEPKFHDHEERTVKSPTNGNQFTAETRGKARPTIPRAAMQDRLVSPGAARTADAAVQMDGKLADVVDKSQQFSDPSHFGSQNESIVPVRKINKEKAPKQQAEKLAVKPAKMRGESLEASEPILLKGIGNEKQDTFDTSFTTESQESAQNSVIRQLMYLKCIFPTSSQSRSHEAPVEDSMKHTMSVDKGGDSSQSADGATEVKKHGEAFTAVVEEESNVPSTSKIPVSNKNVHRTNIKQNRLRNPLVMTASERGIRKGPTAEDNSYSITEVDVQTEESRPEVFKERSKGSTAPLSSSARTPVTEEPDVISPLARGTARAPAYCLVDADGTRSEHCSRTSETINAPLPNPLILATSTREMGRLVTNRETADEMPSEDGVKTGVKKDLSPHGSLSSSTTLVDHRERQPAKGSRQVGRYSPDPQQQGIQGSSSRFGIHPNTSSAGKNFSKGNPWGEWLSQTEGTFSGGSRLDGYMPPSRHRTPSSGSRLSPRPEFPPTRAEAAISLELGFRSDRRMSFPDSTLGSTDVGSSEPGRQGPQPAFRHSVEITPKIVSPGEDLAPVGSASNYIVNKPQKRVSFQDQLFSVVLAGIEADSPVPRKEEYGLYEDNRKGSVNNDSAAEETIGYSESLDKRITPASSIENRERAAELSAGVVDHGEGSKQAKKETGAEKSPPPSKMQRVSRKEGIECSAERENDEVTEATVEQNVDERSGIQEPHGPPTSLSFSRSGMGSSRNTGVSRYFYRSDDEPLPPSASTALSFISSESNVSVLHHVTDLKSLDALATLAAPFPVIGEGKPHMVGTSFPDRPQLEPPPQQGTREQRSQRLEPQEELPQEAKQPGKQVQPCQEQATASAGSPALSGASKARCTLGRRSKKALHQESSQEHRAGQPLKRSISTEAQRFSRRDDKERRRGDDIMRVILMGNEHYLRERAAMSPRPLSAAFIATPPLIDTQHSSERARTSSSDSVRTGISMPMDLATKKSRGALTSLPKGSVASRDSSASGTRRASPQANVMMGPARPRPSSLPSSPVSQRPSRGASPRPPSLGSPSPDPQASRQITNLGPGGEQRKMNTIAEAVCEIQLEDPPAIAAALGAKVSDRKTVGVLSGDTLELNSPVQLVVESDADHLASNLTSEVEGESRLTPMVPNWDACERELMTSVKMLAQTIGTPESSSKTIELPSPEDLFMSETSTLEIRLDDALPSSITYSDIMDPSDSVLSRARTESPKRSRNRRLSAMMPEGPCFEFLYNSILESGGSLDIPTSIQGPGSLDFSSLLVARERSSGPTSALSSFTFNSGDHKLGRAADTTTTSGSASLAPVWPATGSRGGHFGEDCEPRRRKTSESESGAPRGATPSRASSRSSVRPAPKPTTRPSALALKDNLVFDFLEDEDNDEAGGDRSPFFSFEESASETSLVPEAANSDRPAPPRTPPSNLG